MKYSIIRVLNLFTIMNRGGAETMVMNYYRNIDREKVQFDFMVHRSEKAAYEDEINELGGKIFRESPIRPWSSPHYTNAIKEFYSTHSEYKIIHSHMSELGYYDFLVAEKYNIPVRICHAHNAPHGIDLKSPIRWYYKKRMLPHITHMFTCGQESADWLFGKKNSGRFIQLNNAVDSEKFVYNEETEKEIRRRYGLRNRFIVGHVGRFSVQKNHKFLIEIFNEIQKINPHSTLMLVGDGELRSEVLDLAKKLKIEDKIIVTGFINNVNEVIQCFDAFVFPSLFEGLSVTSIENQAAGNICFIPKEIPQQCVVTDNVNSISLKQSAYDWAKCIIDKSAEHQKQDMRNEITKAGFDIKSNAKWLEEFYINEYNKYK